MATVGIIGAGHVGCALAFDIGSRGYDVILRSMPGHPGNLPKIKNNGNVLECAGLLTGHLEISVTEGLGDVSSFTETIIIVTVPSQGHDLVLGELAQYDLTGRTVIFITGNGVGVRARQTLNAQTILDTSTSPYSSRVNADGLVTVRGIKKRLQIGPIGCTTGEEHRNELARVFNMSLDWSSTIMEIFMSSLNGVVHVPTAVMNLGWIETTNGDFYFYRQGMSVGVCSIIEAADRERLAVAEAYQSPIKSALEAFNTNYGRQEKTFRDFAQNTDAHNKTKGAQKRFLSQDVPYWLVLCSELGAKAGVRTPVIDMMISLASTFSGTDYRMVGRTLKSLGLGGASMEEVMGAFAGGSENKGGLMKRSARQRKTKLQRFSQIYREWMP